MKRTRSASDAAARLTGFSALLSFSAFVSAAFGMTFIDPASGITIPASEPAGPHDVLTKGTLTVLTSGSTAIEGPFAAPSPLPFHTPEFNKITDDSYLPAFEAGMQEQLKEIEAIANNPDAPTFENTITAMEKTGALLTRVRNVFFNMTSAHTNEQIQKVQAEVAPKLAAHSDNILLNPRLFTRVKTLFEMKASLGLTEEQQQVLKEQYESFVRAGAMLSEAEQTRIRAINEELSSLTTTFQDNLLAVTKERAVVIDDVAALDGMSAGDIAAAKEAAEAEDSRASICWQSRIPLASPSSHHSTIAKLDKRSGKPQPIAHLVVMVVWITGLWC